MPRMEKTTILLLTPTRNPPRRPPTRILILPLLLLLLLLLLWTLLPVVLSPRPLQSSTSPQRLLIHTPTLTLIHTLTLTHTLQPTPLPIRIPPCLQILSPLVIPSPPHTRNPTRIALPTPIPARFRLLHSSIPLPPCPSVQTVSPFTRSTQHLPRPLVMQVYTMLGQ